MIPSRLRLILFLFAVLLGAACSTPPTTPDPMPRLAGSALPGARGTLIRWPDGAPLADRQFALCRVESSGSCRLLASVYTSDAAGEFEIAPLEAGEYLVMVDSGSGDFAAAAARWADQRLRPGSRSWVAQEFLGVEDGAAVNIAAPGGIAAGERAQYAADTLLIGGSPFVAAHPIDGGGTRYVLTVEQAGVTDAEIPVVLPAPVDFAAVRARIGALDREEARLLDPEVVRRWGAFHAGDDSAYSDGDVAAIDALRSGALIDGTPIYRIGEAMLTRIDVYEGAIVKRTGYMVFDHQSGEPTIIGWVDEDTGDVIEAATGYRLNVRDHPGEWIEEGPNGEQFYHYGWSYYRRWRRILPDPLIAIAERFRTEGAANVTRYLSAYQQAADEYDQGDLTLVDWSDSTAHEVAGWAPPQGAAPYLSVPDSGTIDVRRERFYEAVTSGVVFVDEASVERFLQGDAAVNGFFYSDAVTVQGVIDALLMPYRAGHLYTDFEAAIILAATYEGEGPLAIRVTGRMPDGAFVPRHQKEVFFADGEVADVILGYSGTLIARWPHEMGHVLDFRDERNVYPRRPATSLCEPFKYMMEYMWWVERFPYDAPDWDWQPVGSGLTLARLLTATYPNSGC